MKKRLLLVLPCLIASLLLAACGGGEDGDASSDEAQVEEAIEAAAVSNDPAECTTAVTVAYLEQTTGLSGEAATKQCEKEAPDKSTGAVWVSDLEVQGAGATAEVTLEGSDFKGDTVKLALVNEDGSWKIDEFVRFVPFDRAAYLEGVEEGIEKAGDLPPSVASCFVEQVEQLPDATLEESALSAKRGEEFSRELASACARAAS